MLLYFPDYDGRELCALQVTLSTLHIARAPLHGSRPRKITGFRLQRDNIAPQNLCPLNSRWLWFGQYFVRCRDAGFRQYCPGLYRPKVAGGAGIRMLPNRFCVWLPSHNCRITVVLETNSRSIRTLTRQIRMNP